jgi:UDP-hydrolysing UDP-N-acetyl-D-glucosamine 2-epimerase
MISVGVITTSRADYSLLRPLIAALNDVADFKVSLLVSGGHLCPRNSNSLHEIELDGCPIAAHIPLHATGNTAISISQQMAHAIHGFATHFAQSKPDLLIALGDRHEMFAAVTASVPFNIPVAHINGGELTYGAHDDNYRHALTKLSHIHFASTQEYAHRIAQMGEEKSRIFNVGVLSLDAIRATQRLNKEQLFERFNLTWETPPILVTLHAETKSNTPAGKFARTMFDALENRPETIIITHPNADVGGEDILAEAQAFQVRRNDVFIVPSFGAIAFYSMLDHAALMIGNSSSGIVEAQFFDLPVVNIGARQDGRLRSSNIFDVPMEEAALKHAIDKALSSELWQLQEKKQSPYGVGRAAEKIVSTLQGLNFNDHALLQKTFKDIGINSSANSG